MTINQYAIVYATDDIREHISWLVYLSLTVDEWRAYDDDYCPIYLEVDK